MTDKKPTTPASNKLSIVRDEGKSDARMLAELAVGGVMNSLYVLNQANHDFAPIEVTEGYQAMQSHVEAVHSGKLEHMETMLISQAMALDSLFASMALRAQNVMGKDQLHVMQTYMKLALKAQSQCRTTLETLANIKNPRPYIQHNKAQYQQVNNGAAQPETRQYSHAHARAGENQKQANELLTHQPGQPVEVIEDQAYETVDSRRASQTSRTDKAMATVDA